MIYSKKSEKSKSQYPCYSVKYSKNTMNDIRKGCKIKDLTGEILGFGQWKAIKFSHREDGRTFWNFECQKCKNEKTILVVSARNKKYK